jgi:hypothetical protein
LSSLRRPERRQRYLLHVLRPRIAAGRDASRGPAPAPAGSDAGFLSTPQFQAPVPNYLVPAILTTVFCCLPFGIVSIVYAAQVNGKLEAGNRAGAIESSNKAKKWAWISFGTGLVLIVGYLVLVVLGAAVGGAGGTY